MANKRNNRKKHHLKSNDKDFLPIQNKIVLNPTVILFAFVFVFLIICIIRLALRETTGYYEVLEGNNGKASIYSVFVAREEELVKSKNDGFVSYLVNSGERVRVGQAIYTLDENGNFTNNYISANSENNSLERDSLIRIKNAIRTYSISYDADNFEQIYGMKTDLNNKVISYLTDDIIHNLSSATDDYTFNVTNSENCGVFTTTYDGYENFNPDKFYANELKTDGYELTRLKSTQEVKRGDPIYKLVTKDSFSIIFQMTEEDVVKYWDTKSLKVYFPQIDKELTGEFSFVFAEDDSNTRLARIDFKECGYLFADIRITNIQINSSVIEGLKIPESSLTTKDYYVIPKNYLTKGGNTNSEASRIPQGFNLQIYSNGTLSAKFVEVEDYKTFEDYILIGTNTFNIGDILIAPDSGITYEIGAQKSLQGVYNVNKGFALFKPVNLLDNMQNGFVIIEKGMKGSVSLYDHIALNADLIKEGELIY